MGREGFCNSLLVAMGNVVSALFMYALQAAWLCQRLIDQDYRQNHGSRLKPIADSEPVQIVSEWTPNHKRQNPKPRKLETTKSHGESPIRHGENKRRKCRNKVKAEHRLNSSHPYLKETSDAPAKTLNYVKRLGQNLALRRAFSDVNLSSSCSHFDDNQNYLNETTTVSVADQDFLMLMFSKGYVT